MSKQMTDVVVVDVQTELICGTIKYIGRVVGILVDRTEPLQTDPICISLVQGIQAHLNELETRLRLLSEPDSVTKERQTA